MVRRDGAMQARRAGYTDLPCPAARSACYQNATPPTPFRRPFPHHHLETRS